MLDLQTTQTTVIEIARQAAAILLNYYDKPLSHTTKSAIVDIVTEADQAADKLIVSALRETFPGHHIVSEEGGKTGVSQEDAEYSWYVDPLDGTTNFVNGIPHFAVSIGLTDFQQQPILGVIYNPVSQELFSAAIGCGATCNGKPIRVSAKTDLIECVLASGFPHTKTTDPDNNLKQWETFLMRTRDLRRLGSAALELCFVACGRLDGYWERNLHRWDYAAGVTCVREAGGVVTDYQGSPTGFMQQGRIIASNGVIHPQMLAHLQD